MVFLEFQIEFFPIENKILVLNEKIEKVSRIFSFGKNCLDIYTNSYLMCLNRTPYFNSMKFTKSRNDYINILCSENQVEKIKQKFINRLKK